jgi:nucleotide-binding universal stress UspA family protein
MSFFRKVLIAVDDSAASQYGVETGLAIAQRDACDVVFAVVLEPSFVARDYGFMVVGEVAEMLADELSRSACARAAAAGIACTAEIFFDDPRRGIVELAEREDVGLVVLGRHADPPLIRLLTRNIVDEVLRTTTIPLCVVRRPRTGNIYHRILVPVVDDDLSRIATAYATSLAKTFGSTLLFCTIGGSAGDATAILLERTKSEAIAAGVAADGLVVERTGKLSGTIVRNAYAQGCDAIIMATRAREGLPILAEGSVTEAVVRTSDVPVIAVRGD